MRQARFSKQLEPQAQDVPHLFAPAGFLDGSGWHRTLWLLGTKMGSGYKDWHDVGNASPSGYPLVAAGDKVYGFGLSEYGKGKDPGLSNVAFQLFAKSAQPSAASAKGGPKTDVLWSAPVGLHVQAMLMADKALVLGGGPPLFPDASLGKPAGPAVWIASPQDGKKLTECALKAPPVWDGLAAARGRLFLVTTDGKITCYGG